MDVDIVDGHLIATHDRVKVVALANAGLPLHVLGVDVGELGTGVDDKTERLVGDSCLRGDIVHGQLNRHGRRVEKGLVAVADGEETLLAVDDHAVVIEDVHAEYRIDVAPQEFDDRLDVEAHDTGVARIVLAHDGEGVDAAEGDGAAGVYEHLMAVAVDDEVAVEDLEGE